MSGHPTGVTLGTGRLEAFSDGVLAIIITIMVLELKVPHDASLAALESLLPMFISYVVSFIYIGIYWNNHHHLMHACTRVTGGILWANLYLLFWLSLVPFVTAWMGENHFGPAPTALYGVVLLMAGLAYVLLQQQIIASQGPESLLRRAIQQDRKGKASYLLYAVAIVLAFRWRWAAQAIYVFVALLWLVPDKRIEATLGSPTTAP